VDESANGSGTLYSPDDAMQDAFFNNITVGLTPVTSYDANEAGKLSLSDLAAYEAVVYHNLSAELGSQFNANKQDIKKYLDFGGKMVIFTDKPGKLIEGNNSYPCKYDTSSIAYKYFGLDSALYTIQNRCSGAMPAQTGFSYLSVDTAKATSSNGEHIKKLETLRPRSGISTIFKKIKPKLCLNTSLTIV